MHWVSSGDLDDLNGLVSRYAEVFRIVVVGIVCS